MSHLTKCNTKTKKCVPCCEYAKPKRCVLSALQRYLNQKRKNCKKDSVTLLYNVNSSLLHHQFELCHPVAGSRVGLGGFKPTHFQKRHPWDFRKSEDFFWGVGGVGGRVEREKAWAVSDCVKQTATSTRCYYSVKLRSLIYCSDQCWFWNPIQSRFA